MRVVHLPTWFTSGWRAPAELALAAVVIGVAIQYAIGIIFGLGVVIGLSPGYVIPWGELVRYPLFVWLSFHNAVSGKPVLVTGYLWIALSFVLAARLVAGELRYSDEDLLPRRIWVLVGAAKASVIYALVVVVAAGVATSLVTTTISIPSGGTSFGIPLGGLANFAALGGANLVPAIFVSLFLGFAVALVSISRRCGADLEELVGVRLPTMPFREDLRASYVGARRGLLVAGVGMLAFFFATNVLDLGSASPGLSAQDWLAATLVTAATMVLWAGVDVGLGAFILSLRFFAGSHGLEPTGKPVWVYAAMVITVAAFLVAGYVAAQRARRPDGYRSALVGLWVGAWVSAACLVFSLFHAGSAGGSFVATALFLPLIWAVLAAVGGLYYSGRQGHPLGVRVEASRAARRGPDGYPPGSPGTVPGPGPAASTGATTRPTGPLPSTSPPGPTCVRCGAGNPSTAAFCQECGTPIAVTGPR